MATKEELLRKTHRPPVAITVPVHGEVLLRHPTYAEWHQIVSAHKNVSGAPPADLVAKTVAMVLAEPDGTRQLTDAEAREFLANDCDVVASIYRQAWETVLDVGTSKIEAAEKN